MIQGVELFPNFLHQDNRGSFIKTLSSSEYNKVGPTFQAAEHFISISKKNVFRGLHLQAPPSQHTKIVSCLTGSVIDFVIDLRKASGSFMAVQRFHLENGEQSLIIPPGVAHGFLCVSERAIMNYLLDAPYDPQ